MEQLKAFRKGWKKYLLISLLLANLFVWSSVYARSANDVLSVYFIDVGQGDAILIESPTKGRVLIDGGPNRKVVSELGKILPFGDKRLDVVIATHPDADHIGGLPEVVSRFEVGAYVESAAQTDNSIHDELHARLDDKGVQKLVAKQGMIIDLGRGARLIVLFPDRDVSGWDPNDASVVARLDYGEDSFLLTGDIELRTEQMLLNAYGPLLDTDVLKVGHHGSRTSTSASFLAAVSPEYAVISAGKDNRYGHPHQDVLNNLISAGAETMSTYEDGTVVFRTDGRVLEIK